MSKKLILGGVATVLLLSAGGAAAWWKLKDHGSAGEAKAHVAEAVDYKYVTLDKVIVMLRNGEQESGSHYLAVDLVFKAPPKTEKQTRDHLPLLRSVAVKALSERTRAQASSMGVDALASTLNEAFHEAYAAEHQEMPFAEAMIGKLIVE
ncbi:flagellar basal body-associated FliL family protein [Ideonella azotifigens]|uniref:Flagellar protein FliL n=1 Tax=Ideonella azotifigens TaxID=513160 RepID=A0ABN1K942_9BURK|nr:flagellar basal body-associated FliL family protein [Ideonella azotifigens]MCD2339107.1 flagellar basal body-associated FliL family protein [Ideonella azotifigens]